jgi:hypothetical protein
MPPNGARPVTHFIWVIRNPGELYNVSSKLVLTNFRIEKLVRERAG